MYYYSKKYFENIHSGYDFSTLNSPTHKTTHPPPYTQKSNTQSNTRGFYRMMYRRIHEQFIHTLVHPVVVTWRVNCSHWTRVATDTLGGGQAGEFSSSLTQLYFNTVLVIIACLCQIVHEDGARVRRGTRDLESDTNVDLCDDIHAAAHTFGYL